MNKPKKLCQEIINFTIRSEPESLKDLSTGRLAFIFGYNRSYLSKTFKKCIGVNLSKYLLRIKILRCAFIILEKKELKIWQIANYFGWERQETFIKEFKKFFGITPGKFKNLIQ